ncbi:hypothetical protein Slin15195_G052220 [Septoria linicola]|uniref:P-loop containing nucleoside triphosphate hydrolase protein n=1 Tax=Septoria linicola TaxID=215465 RepID=A0A9Q9EK02_9PEZI|nr:hypothetical protein Slin14017_G127700 [Septoria linicola]USW51903.1 hypothetical protein Slin15195_G052220 [Septoria linicola]
MAPNVIVLGLPRTGTQSIADALHLLGYEKVWHMRELHRSGAALWDEWTELLRDKQDNKQFHRGRLTKVLQEYDAITDLPPALFGPEIIAAVPRANLIVLERDEDSWFRSFSSTLWAMHNPTNGKPDTPVFSDEHARALQASGSPYNEYMFQNDFLKHGRDFYRRYYSIVRKELEAVEK